MMLNPKTTTLVLGLAVAPAMAQNAPGKAAALAALPFVLLGLLAAGWGVTVALAALCPRTVAGGRTALAERPWLCLAWGALVALVLAGLAGLFGNAGEGGEGLALLVLLATALLLGFGFSALAELLGERAWLLAGRPASRLANLSLGAVLLATLLLTPPGWLLAPVAALAMLGAARLGLRRRPPVEPA